MEISRIEKYIKKDGMEQNRIEQNKNRLEYLVCFTDKYYFIKLQF